MNKLTQELVSENVIDKSESKQLNRIYSIFDSNIPISQAVEQVNSIYKKLVKSESCPVSIAIAGIALSSLRNVGNIEDEITSNTRIKSDTCNDNRAVCPGEEITFNTSTGSVCEEHPVACADAAGAAAGAGAGFAAGGFLGALFGAIVGGAGASASEAIFG
jgi:hypothetical protein